MSFLELARAKKTEGKKKNSYKRAQATIIYVFEGDCYMS